MSFAPHSSVATQSYRPRRYSSRSRNLTTSRVPSSNLAKGQPSSSVETLPTPEKRLPAGLQFLLLVQKSSSAIAFGLIIVALGIYAWTVYAPKQWSQEYRKLETLQKYERHLTATNETLKNQLAQQAEKPGSGLTEPHPSQNIYMPPMSNSSLNQIKPNHSLQTKPLIINTPLAY